MSGLKKMIENDKKVKFIFYRDGDLWYETECGFKFAVPVSDAGTGVFNSVDRAILFMRWIRKQLDSATK